MDSVLLKILFLDCRFDAGVPKSFAENSICPIATLIE